MMVVGAIVVVSAMVVAGAMEVVSRAMLVVVTCIGAVVVVVTGPEIEPEISAEKSLDPNSL
jgi:hypothetical protein